MESVKGPVADRVILSLKAKQVVGIKTIDTEFLVD